MHYFGVCYCPIFHAARCSVYVGIRGSNIHNVDKSRKFISLKPISSCVRVNFKVKAFLIVRPHA